ncbi:hypothetical protein HK105_206087 [Polyrhizophydium stewartii]|uniref:RING-type domain-containing protein n=1 Tax=Polyrhizophydium stewartii TaxID=2732419 RepID=A0ABR4N4B1_9FUNG
MPLPEPALQDTPTVKGKRKRKKSRTAEAPDQQQADGVQDAQHSDQEQPAPPAQAASADPPPKQHLFDDSTSLDKIWRHVESQRAASDPTTFYYIDRLRTQVHSLQRKLLAVVQENKLNKQRIVELLASEDKLRAAATCPICLDVFAAPQAIQCGHTYCFHCLREWMRHQSEDDRAKCPTCRALITSAPIPNVVMEHQVETVIDRMPAAERDELRRRIERNKVDRSAHENPWEGVWAPQGMADLADGVIRCVVCGWEIVDGACAHDIDLHDDDGGGDDTENDEQEYAADDQEEYGRGSGSDISEYDDGEGFVVADDDIEMLEEQSDSDDDSDDDGDDDDDDNDDDDDDDDDDELRSGAASARNRKRPRARRVVGDSDDSDAAERFGRHGTHAVVAKLPPSFDSLSWPSLSSPGKKSRGDADYGADCNSSSGPRRDDSDGDSIISSDESDSDDDENESEYGESTSAGTPEQQELSDDADDHDSDLSFAKYRKHVRDTIVPDIVGFDDILELKSL